MRTPPARGPLVPLLLAVVAVTGATASSPTLPPQATPRPAQPSHSFWADAVERHEPGRMDEAAQTVASWTKSEVEKVGGYFLTGLSAALTKTTPGSEEERTIFRQIDRAVLLHTDIALLAHGKAAPGFSNFLVAEDGEVVGTGNSLHLELAAHLVDLGLDRRGKDSQVSANWHRAVSSSLLQQRRFGEAAVVLTMWRKALLGSTTPDRRVMPRDPSFLFAYGCLHEGLAAPGVRKAAPTEMVAAGYVDSAMHGLAGSVSPGGTPWIFSTAVSGFAINLEQAFLAYREAVGLDRRAAEARVRLGRVECVRGSCGSGMRNLRAGGEASADPVVKYYAAMFLGQAEEARGRHDEARLEYERAAALFPTAQSPLLALSALARRTGDGQAADRAAERLWSLPVAGDDRRDPWWEYDAGPRDGPALLKGVYDALAGGLR